MSSFGAAMAFRNGVRLSNRLAVAPMTTSQSHPDGQVSDAEIAWLTRLAADGYGMVITCAAAISKASIAFPNQMSLGDDAFLPGLTRLAGAMKAHPTVAVVQLCHGGSRAVPSLTGVPAHSASAYDLPEVPGFVRPRELSPSQIEAILSDFGDATERAMKAGFDGIELHGANGYLFTQFISTMTNQRRDGWGGSLENRARFSREAVRACRRRVPAGFSIGFRMTFEGGRFDTGLDLDENIQIMNWLAEDGVDYGHVSHLDFAASSVKYPDELALARIRAGVDRALPLVCAGGVMSAEDATRALELGADVVALGRAAVGNTRILERFERGEVLVRPPYAVLDLADKSVSADFIRYMKTAVPVSSLNIVA